MWGKKQTGKGQGEEKFKQWKARAWRHTGVAHAEGGAGAVVVDGVPQLEDLAGDEANSGDLEAGEGGKVGVAGIGGEGDEHDSVAVGLGVVDVLGHAGDAYSAGREDEESEQGQPERYPRMVNRTGHVSGREVSDVRPVCWVFVQVYWWCSTPSEIWLSTGDMCLEEERRQGCWLLVVGWLGESD
jgi:hypothetical protein